MLCFPYLKNPEVLQATLSGAFRDTTSVLRLVLLGAGINAVLTPIAVVVFHAGSAGQGNFKPLQKARGEGVGVFDA